MKTILLMIAFQMGLGRRVNDRSWQKEVKIRCRFFGNYGLPKGGLMVFLMVL